MDILAVNLVLEKLVKLISEEAHLLGRVSGDLDALRDDFESMKSFLQDAETRSESNQGIRTWVKQVREVSYDAENVLETFLLRLSPPQGGGFIHSLHKGYHYLQSVRTRHRLAFEIQLINEKVNHISKRRQAFSFKRVEESTSSGTTSALTWHDPRVASLFVDEGDLVAIQNPKRKLISWLVEENQSLSTISVVGMGGVGKTTLVRKAYESGEVKSHFRSRAWVTVSKSYTTVDLLRALMKDFLEEANEMIPEGLQTTSELQLVNKLRDYLSGKRYIVVFDDVWDTKAWNIIRSTLCNSHCGSRMILTTRNGDVVDPIDGLSGNHVYHLNPLPEEEAWSLFCTRAFRGVNRGICPKELMQTSRSILKKCGGLPLAIVSIASLLSKKEKLISEWKRVHDSLAAEMKSNSNLEDIEKIILLSYKNLPYHLKCCFLYMSVFPEDYLIRRTKLVRLWVVERFVVEKPGLTLEEVAEGYLNELVSRNMIQIVNLDYFNRVRTCRVHDIMREIIQMKSLDESFVAVLNDGKLSMGEKVRILAVHGGGSEALSSAMTWHSSPRSLLVFVWSGKEVLKDFTLLRVIELEGTPLYKFPQVVTEMVLLRYLSLRRTMIKMLPESIGKLKNLEILDLKYSPISSVPKGILKMKNLCQLRGYSYDIKSFALIGISVPEGVGRLTKLEKLGCININGNGKILRDLGNLKDLRMLSVLGLTRENGSDLYYTLEKLKHLTSLYIISIVPTETLHLDSNSSPPQFLQRMYIKSSLASLPNWILSLSCLGKLVLQHSNLKDDPLRALQVLPNLIQLELTDAFIGEEMCCDIGGYPKLRKLALIAHWELKVVLVEHGAMPALIGLDLGSCREMKSVPTGIEHLGAMEYLSCWNMSSEFYRKIKRLHGEDFWKVQHIKTIETN